MSSSSPAHLTKHVPSLHYSFRSSTWVLSQRTDGIANGTALWLGGQCLSIWLAQFHTKYYTHTPNSRPRAIELGSGIGLTALALGSLGWDVLATDIAHVISSVLGQNIKNNLIALPQGSGIVQVKELDWSIPAESWTWSHPHLVASASLPPQQEEHEQERERQSSPLQSPPPPCIVVSDTLATIKTPTTTPTDSLRPPFDLIFSADTVYSTDLVQPLLRAFHTLSKLSMAASSSRKPPMVLLCIERRDPLLVDSLLADAKDVWGFSVHRVPLKKLVKAIEKEKVRWTREDWEGIELWEMKLEQGTKIVQPPSC